MNQDLTITMTKQERLEHYKYALHMLKTGENTRPKPDGELLYNPYSVEWLMYRTGICELLTISIGFSLRYKDLEELFPEFYALKPNKYATFWWDKNDRRIRKNVLIDIIMKLTPSKELKEQITSETIY